MVQAAMVLHQRYAGRSRVIVEGFLRVAKSDGNASEIARWSTILQTVKELDRD
jgi:hypothetical protein